MTRDLLWRNLKKCTVGENEFQRRYRRSRANEKREQDFARPLAKCQRYGGCQWQRERRSQQAANEDGKNKEGPIEGRNEPSERSAVRTKRAAELEQDREKRKTGYDPKDREIARASKNYSVLQQDAPPKLILPALDGFDRAPNILENTLWQCSGHQFKRRSGRLTSCKSKISSFHARGWSVSRRPSAPCDQPSSRPFRTLGPRTSSFSEAQFEAYRNLGEYVGDKMFLPAMVGAVMAGPNADVVLEQ